jgi:hypothetical protein
MQWSLLFSVSVCGPQSPFSGFMVDTPSQCPCTDDRGSVGPVGGFSYPRLFWLGGFFIFSHLNYLRTACLNMAEFLLTQSTVDGQAGREGQVHGPWGFSETIG